jgi:hypothetical protein
MPNSKRKCKFCKVYHPAEDGVQTNSGWFCGNICLSGYQFKAKSPKTPKRKPKTSLQKRKDNPGSKYWRNKADDLWSTVIHAKYDRCAVDNADCSARLEAHHLIGRRNTLTRHSIENGILLCSQHHKHSQYISAHGAPMAFFEWHMTALPDQSKWCSDNKYKTGKPDYKAAYEHLLNWCEINGVEV